MFNDDPTLPSLRNKTCSPKGRVSLIKLPSFQETAAAASQPKDWRRQLPLKAGMRVVMFKSKITTSPPDPLS